MTDDKSSDVESKVSCVAIGACRVGYSLPCFDSCYEAVLVSVTRCKH